MSEVWDDPSLIDETDFYKFLVVGDSASGVIQEIGRKEWPPTPPSTTPKIDAELKLTDDETGEEKVLTVGTVRLKEAFIEARPVVGDHVSVTLKRIEPRGNGKSMKHYDVQITKGGAPAAAPAAQAAPVAAPVAAAPVDDGAGAVTAAALTNLGLTPEQLASLRALQPQG